VAGQYGGAAASKAVVAVAVIKGASGRDGAADGDVVFLARGREIGRLVAANSDGEEEVVVGDAVGGPPKLVGTFNGVDAVGVEGKVLGVGMRGDGQGVGHGDLVDTWEKV